MPTIGTLHSPHPHNPFSAKAHSIRPIRTTCARPPNNSCAPPAQLVRSLETGCFNVREKDRNFYMIMRRNKERETRPRMSEGVLRRAKRQSRLPALIALRNRAIGCSCDSVPPPALQAVSARAGTGTGIRPAPVGDWLFLYETDGEIITTAGVDANSITTIIRYF